MCVSAQETHFKGRKQEGRRSTGKTTTPQKGKNQTFKRAKRSQGSTADELERQCSGATTAGQPGRDGGGGRELPNIME